MSAFVRHFPLDDIHTWYLSEMISAGWKLDITKAKKIRQLREIQKDSLPTSSTTWVLDLKITDPQAILNDKLLTVIHIITSMKIFSKDHLVMVQPSSVILTDGYEHCPFETIQIATNSALHWV